MAYDDNDKRMNHAASRPPAAESDDGELFTEIPLASPRARSSGRPADYPEQRAYLAPGSSGTPVRPTRSGSRPTAQRARFTELSWGGQPQGNRPRASFTEIPWSSVQPGGQAGESPRFAPPEEPSHSTPAGEPGGARFSAPGQERSVTLGEMAPARKAMDDYARMPAPRQTRRGGEETFADPFREIDPSAYSRTVPRQTPPEEAPPSPDKRRAQFAVPPVAAPIRRPRADFNRPAAPRTAARHAAPSDSYPRRSPAIPEAENGLPIEAWQTRPRPVVKKKGIHPAFYVIGVLLAFLIILGIGKGIKAISGRGSPDTHVAATAVPVERTESTPDPEATPTPEPTPTPAPTATPSGAKAVNTNGYIAPADWGCVLWPREKEVYDSFFDNSCMIGNSLVEGFFMYSGLSNIKYIYNTGAVITKVFGYLDLYPLEVNTYDNVYLMFGLNEVGSDVESFITNYATLIDYIRDHQPGTNITVISITPVTQGVDADPNEAQSMERIRLFNERLQQLCKEKGCWYLDIFSMLLDGEGFLSADYAYAGDGKHFEKSGYVAWANYMKTHYVDDGLLK